jgi:hypothetical protein
LHEKYKSISASYFCRSVLRQRGKTTLCRMALANKPSVNLEQPDVRELPLQESASIFGAVSGWRRFGRNSECAHLVIADSVVDRC